VSRFTLNNQDQNDHRPIRRIHFTSKNVSFCDIVCLSVCHMLRIPFVIVQSDLKRRRKVYILWVFTPYTSGWCGNLEINRSKVQGHSERKS